MPTPEEHKIIYTLFKQTFDPKNVGWKETAVPDGAVWMDSIYLSNILHSNLENRYAYKYMFGGYLMHESVQLSTTLAWKLR